MLAADLILKDAIQAVIEAKHRRDRQIALMADLADQPEAYTSAAGLLRQIEQTLRLAQAHLTIIESTA